MAGQTTALDRHATRRELDDYDLSKSPCNLLKRALKHASDLFIEEVGDAGLRPQQFTTLITIYQNPGITQNDLVKLTGSDRSTIAELIARLEAREAVTRERDDRDQRVNRIQITEAGTRALQASVRGVVRAEERFFEVVPPHLRSYFNQSLQLLGDEEAFEG